MSGDYGEPNTIGQLPNPKWERPELEPRRGLVLFPWWVWPLVILGVIVIVGGTWIAVIKPGSAKKPVIVLTSTPTQGAAAFVTATKASTGLPAVPSTPGATGIVPASAATPLATTVSATSVPGATGALQIGSEVVVTGVGTVGLNVRASASLTAKVVVVAKEGAAFSVTDGPVSADGHEWWQVQDSSGATGWASGTYLALK